MRRFLLYLIAIIAAAPAVCAGAGKPADIAKYEIGVTRMSADYPTPGTEIANRRPVITVSFARLLTPADPNTVVFMVNGVDVTGVADITPSYAIFTPAKDLKPGAYEVRVTASDVNRNAIEPLAWTFRIKGERPALRRSGPGEVLEGIDATTGSLQISADNVSADYTRGPFFDPSALFREQEGTRANVDLSFNNVSEGRSITASYRHDTLPYFNGAEDKFRMFYYDDNFSSALGNFRFRLSDLTVAGAELEGARVDLPREDWTFTLFGGRSQDPGVSGSFRQLAGGVSAAYKWGDNNTTAVTALSASEDNDPGIAALTGMSPSRDDIISVRHVYSGGPFSADIEGAENTRKARGGAGKARDSAAKLKLRASGGKASGGAEIYSIGKNFYPVSDSNEKYILNDRRGFKVDAEASPLRLLRTGGEYERFEEGAGGLLTNRGSAFVAVGAKAGPALTFRADKLASERGVVSESSGVTFSAAAAGKKGSFNASRVSASWQNVDYSADKVSSDMDVAILSLAGKYGNDFGYAFGYSSGDGQSANAAMAGIPAKSSNISASVDWAVLSRLTWSCGFESLSNSGLNASNRERRYKTVFKFQVDDVYDLSLGYDGVRYSDNVTPGNGYRQNIIRTGMGMKF